MIALRISREEEFKAPERRSVRLYRQEAEELVSRLNLLRPKGKRMLPTPGQRLPPRKRRQRMGPPSMDSLAHWLMLEVCHDLKANGSGRSLDKLIAEILNLHLTPSLRAAVNEFVEGVSPRVTNWWGTTAFIIFAERLRVVGGQGPSFAPEVRRIRPLLRSFQSDPRLLEDVVRFTVIRGRIVDSSAPLESASSSIERHRSIPDARARKFCERFASEIDVFLKCADQVSDFAITLAAKIFEHWINGKLKSDSFSFRMGIDRLTSTYRMVPLEIFARLIRHERAELRIVTPATLVGARFVAYVTRLGILEQKEDWIDTVDLVDRLSFPGVLSLIHPCPVCGRWIFATTERRIYCSDRCRYIGWAATAQGKERRRSASANYRKRFGEDVRKAMSRNARE